MPEWDPKTWIALGGSVRLLLCQCGCSRWITKPDGDGEVCAECGAESVLSVKQPK